MQQRDNTAHFILTGAVVFGLTLLVAVINAQAQITFSSDRDGNFEIYVMDTDGENQRNLTNNPQTDASPSWSPDGKHIAFASNRLGNWEIYVMNVNGENQRRLTRNDADDLFPSWSPDGEHIAFMSDRDWNWEIYVLDVDVGVDDDGKVLQRLTENLRDDMYSSWSPDGKHIAFMSNRDGNFEIYVMDTNGKHQRNLTNNPHMDAEPAWYNPAFAVAPAGKKVTIWGWLKQVVQ